MIAIFAAAAIFVQATHHQCRVPAAAWHDNDLGEPNYGAMERFSQCLCGPDGSVDWDTRPHRRGGWFMHPSCNRNGWNGHRYVETRR